jgi:hypothetical protein
MQLRTLSDCREDKLGQKIAWADFAAKFPATIANFETILAVT